jgi:cullin-4
LVQSKGAGIVSEGNEEKDRAMVQGLLDFRDDMDRRVSSCASRETIISDQLACACSVVREAFASGEAFAGALKQSLEFAINSRENKPAELIAKFVDAHMRAGGRGVAGGSISGERPGCFYRVYQLSH